MIRFIKNHKGIALFALVVILWIGTLFGVYEYLLSLTGSVMGIVALGFSFIANNPWLPLLFLGLYAVRPLFFMPTSVFAIIAGGMFGFWMGLALTVVGMAISAAFTYAIARSWAHLMYQEASEGAGNVSSWQHFLHKKPFETVTSMHLLFLPFDVVNYTAGALRIKPIQFVFGAIIGSIPSTISFLSIGAGVDMRTLLSDGPSLSMFDPYYLLLAVIVAVASFGIAHIVRRFAPVATEPISVRDALRIEKK